MNQEHRERLVSQPDSDGFTTIREAWSPAARAAAAAARGSRGKGNTARKHLATTAFHKAGGKQRSAGEQIRRNQFSDLKKNLYPDYGPRKWEKADYKASVSKYQKRRKSRGLGQSKHLTPTGRLKR